jgi:hypothetical protein
VRRISKLALLGVFSVASLTGCHRPVNKADAQELRAAAEVVLLPHVVEERRQEIKGVVEKSTLPDSIKSSALSGDESEEMRASRIVLAQAGASGDDIRSRVQSLRGLILGITERPMSRGELEAVGPLIDSSMLWAVVDGSLLLGRDEREVGQLTAGMNLTKSPGLTRYGAEMVRNMTMPVLAAWESTPVEIYHGEVRYIAGLFGAREAVEAAVVIFSVLVAVGLVKSGRPIGRTIFAGAFFALALSFLTGLGWNFLVEKSTLSGYGHAIFIAFGVLSILMFLVVGSAIFHPVYFGRWMGVLREAARKNAAHAAFWVTFLAVYREGFEMSLSMTTLSIIGGWAAVFQGLGVGVPVGLLMVAAGWKIHRGFLGVRGMLIASGAMMVLAASSFAALFVNFLEQQGRIIPLYLVEGVPSFLTVITGFSGSAQTLGAFVATSAVLVVPWLLRRARNFSKIHRHNEIFQPAKGGISEALAAVVVAGMVSALAVAAGAGRPDPNRWQGGTIDWVSAIAESKAGRGLLVDTRPPGSSPSIEGATGLPSDNDDNSILQFCDFVKDKKIYVFGDKPAVERMARRIQDKCKTDVSLVRGAYEN